MLAFGSERPRVAQDFTAFLVAVPIFPLFVPLSSLYDETKLITTFTLSNPLGGASVYMGGINVSTPAGNNPGLEIQAGTMPQFKVLQEDRQLYELQALLQSIASRIECTPAPLEKIPFICWDLTRIFLTSTVNVNVTVAVFPQMYL